MCSQIATRPEYSSDSDVIFDQRLEETASDCALFPQWDGHILHSPNESLISSWAKNHPGGFGTGIALVCRLCSIVFFIRFWLHAGSPSSRRQSNRGLLARLVVTGVGKIQVSLPGVGKCRNYINTTQLLGIFHLQQMFEGDVKPILQLGHLPTPDDCPSLCIFPCPVGD